MTIKLRPYQQRGVSMLLDCLDAHEDAAPIGWFPTGSGKSVIAAALASELVTHKKGAELVLTHRRELVQQNADKLPRHIHGSIFSAGLRSKDLSGQVIFAGIQSLKKHWNKLPRLHTIIIDEPQFATAGYFDFVEQVKQVSPHVRVVGLTATPYNGAGTWLHMLPEKRLFSGIGAEVSIGELLALNHLCPLIPYSAKNQINTSGLEIDTRTGDYRLNQMQAAADIPELVLECADEIRTIFLGRNSVLVFCAGVEHTKHMAAALPGSAVLLGTTPMAERDKIIADFRSGKIKYLCSCEVVLVGFDAPNTDGIACLRPTTSPLVWVQLLGRGMRPHPGKCDCLVADFTENNETFPPVDEIEGAPPKLKSGDTPTKMCDNCFQLILAGLRKCPQCGHEFQFHEGAEKNYDPNTGLLISGVIKNADGSRTYQVERVEYEVRPTRNGSQALVASYFAPGRKTRVAEDWYNMWHHKPSVAARDMTKWIRRLAIGTGAPLNASEALTRAELGALKQPRTVTVAPGSIFPSRFNA